MEIESIVFHLYAFFGMILLDLSWAFYTINISKLDSLKSSSFAVLITLLNGLVTLSVVKDPIYLLSLSLGAFSGTWLAVEYTRRRK